MGLGCKEYIILSSLSHGEVETGERLTCWGIRVINILLPSSYVAVRRRRGDSSNV